MHYENETMLDNAAHLKAQLIALATGGDFDEISYKTLRGIFLRDIAASRLLPTFIRTNVERAGLWAHFKDIRTGDGAYKIRSDYIKDSFKPLLAFLSNPVGPADEGVTKTIEKYNAAGVTDAWQKALERKNIDPEGAITSARTLLEEVCKHILDDAQKAYEEKADLPRLYTETAKLLNLAPSQHTEDIFRRILGSCQAIVEGIGSIRNKISDAHGGGRQKVRPSERHAALTVSLAGAMAVFLIDTWESKNNTTSVPNPSDPEKALLEDFI